MATTPEPAETFTQRAGHVRARLHPRVGPELYAGWLQDPGQLVPADSGSTWRGTSPDGRWFVKLRPGRKGRRALEHTLDVGLLLEDAGVPACLPLALLRAPRLGTPEATWLVSELLEGRDLDLVLAESDEPQRRALVAKVGELIAELHAAGFRQRDLKAPNLMVVEGGSVVLVDLEGIRLRNGGIGRHLRTKDLGRLAASFLALDLCEGPDSAWRQLLARYLERCRELGETPLADLDEWEARSLGRGRAKVKRNAKRGRVLR